MAFFSKTPDPVAALNAARTTLEKRHAAFIEAEGRSRTALERLNAATERLDAARALGVEAASKGEQPQSLETLEKALRDAQTAERAFAIAVDKADNALQQAKDAYRGAEEAERVHRYRKAIARLSDDLDLAAGHQDELTAIYFESPKTLPILALPFLAPDGLAIWKAQVEAFVTPKPPRELPADRKLVKIIKSTNGVKDGAGGMVGYYAVGEVVSFPVAMAERLIVRGYAVAA